MKSSFYKRTAAQCLYIHWGPLGFWKNFFDMILEICNSHQCYTSFIFKKLPALYGVVVLEQQCREHLTVQPWIVRLTHHSRLLFVVISKSWIVWISWVVLRTHSHSRSWCVTFRTLRSTKTNSCEIQILFPIYYLKRMVKAVEFSSSHFRNGCTLCTMHHTLSAHEV